MWKTDVRYKIIDFSKHILLNMVAFVYIPCLNMNAKRQFINTLHQKTKV